MIDVSIKMKYFALMSLVLLCLPLAAIAQTPPAPADSACDPQYYDTLESRAWLEAQREITQNQNLISKPDSVLQYTCFDKHLGALANEATNMFSESAELDSPADIASNYIKSNFTDVHTNLIGDRAATSAPAPSGSVSPAAYSCDIMGKVWKDARCMNFIDEKNNDAFFTLEDYVNNSNDLRFKGNCTKDSRWQTEFDALKPTNTAWEEDDIDAHLDKLDPAKCSGSDAIETGFKVRPNDLHSSGYDEHFCIIPGCYYNPSGSCSTTIP